MTLDERLRWRVACLDIGDEKVVPDCWLMIHRIGPDRALAEIERHRPALAVSLKGEVKICRAGNPKG